MKKSLFTFLIVLTVGIIGFVILIFNRNRLFEKDLSDSFYWQEPTGQIVLEPRIDITTEDRVHLRWVPTQEIICLDNWYLLFAWEKGGPEISRGTPPLARAQADCRPTDLGYECVGDVTGVVTSGTYLFQGVSRQCADGADRVSEIREYTSAPFEIDAGAKME